MGCDPMVVSLDTDMISCNGHISGSDWTRVCLYKIVTCLVSRRMFVNNEILLPCPQGTVLVNRALSAEHSLTSGVQVLQRALELPIGTHAVRTTSARSEAGCTQKQVYWDRKWPLVPGRVNNRANSIDSGNKSNSNRY